MFVCPLSHHKNISGRESNNYGNVFPFLSIAMRPDAPNPFPILIEKIKKLVLKNTEHK